MDRTTTEATLQNALLDYEKHQNKKYDICVFLTSNNIFRNYNWITEAVNNLKKDTLAIDMSSSDPNLTIELDLDLYLNPIFRKYLTQSTLYLYDIYDLNY